MNTARELQRLADELRNALGVPVYDLEPPTREAAVAQPHILIGPMAMDEAQFGNWARNTVLEIQYWCDGANQALLADIAERMALALIQSGWTPTDTQVITGTPRSWRGVVVEAEKIIGR